jgi:hypothetical protein
MKRGVMGGGPSALTDSGPAAVRHGNAASALEMGVSAADTASERRPAARARGAAAALHGARTRRAAGAAANTARLEHVSIAARKVGVLAGRNRLEC